MAKKGSVAPKERINIVYRPATKPGETVELPLKMLVVADLTGEEDERQMEDRKPINVDKDNFHDVMRAQNLKREIVVKDKLSGDPDSTIGMSLKFNTLKDFTPGGIAKQVPELAKLLELREALSALKSAVGNRRAFRNRIEEILEDPEARKKMMDELGLNKNEDD